MTRSQFVDQCCLVFLANCEPNKFACYRAQGDGLISVGPTGDFEVWYVSCESIELPRQSARTPRGVAEMLWDAGMRSVPEVCP